jgi:SAM-dependent methyltransferase
MNTIKELSVLAESDFPSEWYEIIAEGHFWPEWRFRAFLVQLDALGISRTTSWRGLDIGCGHGVVRRQIERCSMWITDGADLNRTALAQNRTQGGETLLYDIHERLPRLAESYDFVVLFDVLEHVADTQAFLRSVVYHLKPGGWLFVNVPALNSLSSAFDRVMGHLRRYNRRTLLAEFTSDALDVRDVRYWGFSMLPYLVMRKLMSSREASVPRVIERGVLPPKPWMDPWIRGAMAVETAHLRNPVIGTSLLAAVVKKPVATRPEPERLPA